MDQREARQYISSNPPQYSCSVTERRPSLIDRFFSRRRTSSTSSDDLNMASSLQRRGSMEQPEVSITQRVQQEMKPQVPPRKVNTPGPEFSIFT